MQQSPQLNREVPQVLTKKNPFSLGRMIFFVFNLFILTFTFESHAAYCDYSASSPLNSQAQSCQNKGNLWNCSYDYCFDETRQSWLTGGTLSCNQKTTPAERAACKEDLNETISSYVTEAKTCNGDALCMERLDKYATSYIACTTEACRNDLNEQRDLYNSEKANCQAKNEPYKSDCMSSLNQYVSKFEVEFSKKELFKYLKPAKEIRPVKRNSMPIVSNTRMSSLAVKD